MGGVATVTVTSARATTSASAASAVELAAASRRRGVGVGDGGGGLAARVLSARPTPRSSRGVPQCRGARHEESNLEPRQLGAAGADHHREISAQPPCQAAPPHGQPGQATAERAGGRPRRRHRRAQAQHSAATPAQATCASRAGLPRRRERMVHTPSRHAAAPLLPVAPTVRLGSSARLRAKLQESCPLPSASTCELILGGWRGRGGRGGGAGCSGLSRATWTKAPDVRAAPQAGQEAPACRGTAAPLEVSGQLSGGTNPRSSGGSLGPRGGSGRRPSLRASLAVGISGSKALRNRLGGRPHNVKRSARKSLQLPRCRRFRGLNRQSTVSVLQSATVGLRHMCFTVVQFNRWPSAPHTRSHDTHTVHCYLKAVPSISSPP